MNALPFIDLLGYWLGIFLTICILSFLYKDNPFYKFAEHLFIGISIGYVIIQQYYNVLRPKVIDEIGDADRWYFNLALIPLILVMMLFVRAASRRLSWMGRYPLAFVVALYAGLQINGYAQGDLGPQAEVAMQSPLAQKIDVNTASAKQLAPLGLPPKVVQTVLDEREARRLATLATFSSSLTPPQLAVVRGVYTGAMPPQALESLELAPEVSVRVRAGLRPFTDLDELEQISALSAEERASIADERGALVGLDARTSVSAGAIDWFGTLSNLLLFFGLIAGLIYFYFSIEHKGTIGKVSRFGVWVIMIGFGAAFGFTVMGRLALMVGRVQDIRGDRLSEAVAAKVNGPIVALVSIVIIVAGLVIWERWWNNEDGEDGSRP